MRRIIGNILSVVFLAIVLVGCKANFPVAQQSGKKDMSYLLFVSQKEYRNKTVQVTIDNGPAFDAKTVSAKKSNRRGQQYGITTGTKDIKVSYEGKTLYQKKVFLST